MVRSCYRALKKEQDNKIEVSDNSVAASDGSFWWKKVWGLKIPPKIRVFWWRAMHGFLPTKQELKRRHVSKDHCETCGVSGEDLYYIAISCTYAIRFWEACTRDHWVQATIASSSDMDKGLVGCGYVLTGGGSSHNLWRLVPLVWAECTTAWKNKLESWCCGETYCRHGPGTRLPGF